MDISQVLSEKKIEKKKGEYKDEELLRHSSRTIFFISMKELIYYLLAMISLFIIYVNVEILQRMSSILFIHAVTYWKQPE